MKITPKITSTHKTVDYSDLKEGNAFMYGGDLYIKSSYGEQMAFCLNESDSCLDGMCGTQVIPVNAEIKWSYKDTKGKKK